MAFNLKSIDASSALIDGLCSLSDAALPSSWTAACSVSVSEPSIARSETRYARRAASPIAGYMEAKSMMVHMKPIAVEQPKTPTSAPIIIIEAM